MMFLFEDGLDEYLEETAVFPHSSKRDVEDTAEQPQETQSVKEAEIRRFHKILSLTSRGIFPETAVQKRIERLIERERG